MEKEIRIIKNKAQNMSDLVLRLLTISREEKRLLHPEREWVDVQLLAESVAEELGEKAKEKEIQIEVINHLENPNICGDMSMLTRLFVNLVDNAITYGRERGYVRISLEDKEEQICLRVEDDGIGMSKEQQKKIWNRFYQAEESRSNTKGFGLGLFMVKQIVGCHKGKISVESELGRGSVFIVELPRK